MAQLSSVTEGAERSLASRKGVLTRAEHPMTAQIVCQLVHNSIMDDYFGMGLVLFVGRVESDAPQYRATQPSISPSHCLLNRRLGLRPHFVLLAHCVCESHLYGIRPTPSEVLRTLHTERYEPKDNTGSTNETHHTDEGRNRGKY